MKKISFVFAFVLMLSGAIFSQQVEKNRVEVLYFKANLSCCMAASCDVLETDIKTLVENNYDAKVVFKEIKIADEANTGLVEKYAAKSQTVVLVKYRKGVEKQHIDVSKRVKQYVFDKNASTFKTDFMAQLQTLL